MDVRPGSSRDTSIPCLFLILLEHCGQHGRILSVSWMNLGWYCSPHSSSFGGLGGPSNVFHTFLGKVIDKIISQQLLKHIDKYQLIPHNQHAVRPSRSTIKAVGTMMDTCPERLNKMAYTAKDPLPPRNKNLSFSRLGRNKT